MKAIWRQRHAHMNCLDSSPLSFLYGGRVGKCICTTIPPLICIHTVVFYKIAVQYEHSHDVNLLCVEKLL